MSALDLGPMSQSKDAPRKVKLGDNIYAQTPAQVEAVNAFIYGDDDTRTEYEGGREADTLKEATLSRRPKPRRKP